jgi:uncharacterized protein
MTDLWAALCLVAVLEGLILFAAPNAWKRAAEQLQALDPRALRRIGAVLMAVGLVALSLVRS